jgi:sterol desaturase/sphingolipid hydroxylase (fatty acid hydroxylase superfamily)
MGLLGDPCAWGWGDRAVFGAGVLAGLWSFEVLLPLLFGWTGRIPATGVILERFGPMDHLFTNFSRLSTVAFMYHLCCYVWHSPKASWTTADLGIGNTVVVLAMWFITYDLAYGLWHRLLHHKALYRHVHKHHHRQHAPDRGNADAINVHPVEFLVGEYLHLAVCWLVPLPFHVSAVAAFILLGGIAASLNHTRFDFRLPGAIFSVADHDLHHHYITANYGQYTMLWDRILGTYKSPATLAKAAKKA